MNLAEVTILAPTLETELIREQQADGKWRIHNGIDFVGDYPTLEKAIKNGLKAGAKKVAKAKYNGEYTSYSEVVYLGNVVDMTV